MTSEFEALTKSNTSTLVPSDSASNVVGLNESFESNINPMVL